MSLHDLLQVYKGNLIIHEVDGFAYSREIKASDIPNPSEYQVTYMEAKSDTLEITISHMTFLIQ